MKRGKKILIIGLLVIIALLGTIGGVAMAQSGDDDTTTTADTARFAYLERVAAIYQEKTGVALDVDKLKDSVCQAGEEKREQVRNQFRQRLIDEGVFTEEELTELEDWWAAKPDITTEFPRMQNRITHRIANRIHADFGGGFGGWCINGNGNSGN